MTVIYYSIGFIFGIGAALLAIKISNFYNLFFIPAGALVYCLGIQLIDAIHSKKD